MALRPEAVPPEVRPLLELAAHWGVGDDLDRERMVDDAPRAELEALVAAVDAVPESMYDWLAGPESYSTQPAPEYLAVTCLTMAVDSARMRLRRT